MQRSHSITRFEPNFTMHPGTSERFTCIYSSAPGSCRQLRGIRHRNLVLHVPKLSVPPKLRHQLNATYGQKWQTHSVVNKGLRNEMKNMSTSTDPDCRHLPKEVGVINSTNENPTQIKKRGADKPVTTSSVEHLHKSDVSVSALASQRGRRKRATELKVVDSRPKSKCKRQRKVRTELHSTAIHNADNGSLGSVHTSVEDSVGIFDGVGTSHTDTGSTQCQTDASTLQASHLLNTDSPNNTDVNLCLHSFISVTSHESTLSKFSFAKDLVKGELSKNDTILQTGSVSEDIDCTSMEVEYPAPSTSQQKETRRLARVKQLEQMRVREAALERKERLLRRHDALRKPDGHRERRVKWKNDMNLVRVFVYPQVTEEVVSSDLQ